MNTDAASPYFAHSIFSDPGEMAAMLDGLPADIAFLREAITPLVFHYMGDGGQGR